jgi:CubicO group peptidase (beta-lactamase class C family)
MAMANTVTLQPPRTGKDGTIIEQVNTWCGDTWGQYLDKAKAALVTFRTVISGPPGSYNVDIQPEVYTYPPGLDWSSGYCIGSVQKVFTGTMLAGRILQGPLNFPPYATDALVKQWLPPQVQNATATDHISHVKLADLATHTSCLTRKVKDENNGLYCPGGPPDQPQIDAWLNNSNWISGCKMGRDYHYSNWGSLTLGFAVAGPPDYVYDDALAEFILPNFGMSAPVTNSCTDTKCVRGYGQGGKNRLPPGTANGIRSSIAEMTQFVGNYLYYEIAPSYVTLGQTQEFAAQMVGLALQPPLPKVPLGLDWFIRAFKVGEASYTLYDKNGMTGAQGFSSYVGFTEPFARSTPDGLVQAGVLVLVNLAVDGGLNTPTAFGKSVLTYLLGGTADRAAIADDEIDDADAGAVP